MIFSIDCTINNINLQNTHLKNIITTGLLSNIQINYNTIPQTQRIIYFNKLISNLKHNLIKCKRNTNISITPKELDEIYIKQFGRCAISKKDLTFYYNKPNKRINSIKNIRKINDFNVSISKIDNNRAYTKENIQLIACRINLMKNTMSINQFIELCSKVVKNNNNIIL